ncbi:MAG TPA: FmdB family zinc ribbon protein [Mycobacterium sp.]|nr:FmdB family zinc ribbon protein [Mycobacterium sp.]
MPTYSYACTACGNRFDAVQAFTDDALTSCPECSGRLRKLFGSVGVVFKGSGFYRTDSRSGSGKASLTADHKAESSSTSTGDASGTTITKPAAPAKPAAGTPAKAPAPAAS